MGKRFRLKEVHIKFLLFVVILVVFALIQPKVFTAINLFSMLNDAVFTGIGTAGTNVVDTLVFGESFSFLKVFFIALLLLVSMLNSYIDSAFVRTVLNWISIFSRFYDFSYGIFNFTSLFYYASIVFVFLFLTVRVYEKKRWA